MNQIIDAALLLVAAAVVLGVLFAAFGVPLILFLNGGF